MDWSSTLGVIAKLAPTMATVLGGPLAGGAVTALGAALGVDMAGSLTDKQKQLTEALSFASPDQLLALKQADSDFALRMAELGFNNTEALEELNVKNLDSARNREINVKDYTPRIIAYAITIGFFTTLTIMLFKGAPEGSRDILNIMIGSLGASFAGIIAYYFGSTSGSAIKSQLLAMADIKV